MVRVRARVRVRVRDPDGRLVQRDHTVSHADVGARSLWG